MKYLCAFIASAAMIAPAFATSTGNLLTNPGGEDDGISPWVESGAFGVQADSGSFDSGISPRTGYFDFVGGSSQGSDTSASLTQHIDLTSLGFDTSAGFTLHASAYEQSLNQGADSDAGLIKVVTYAGSTVVGTYTSPEVSSTNGTWQFLSLDIAADPTITSADYSLIFNRHAGSDLDTFFDDASLTAESSGATPPPTIPEPLSLALLPLALTALTLRQRALR